MKKHGCLIIFFVILFFALFLDKKQEELPKEFLIKNFPKFQQPDEISCGPSCVFMILQYLNIENDFDKVYKLTYTKWFDSENKKIGMTFPDLIVNCFDHYKIKSHIKSQSDINFIKSNITKNKPPIVLVRSSKLTWHYMTAIGYNENNLIFSNPSTGEYEEVNQEVFLNSWNYLGDYHGNNYFKKCVCNNGFYFLNLKCDVCQGSGRIPDIQNFLIQNFKIPSKLLIYIN